MTKKPVPLRACLLGLLVFAWVGVFSIRASVSALSGSTIAALTNNERTTHGLPALAWNNALGNSAAMKAQDMCAKNYWAHTAPDGTTGWTFISQAGYPYIHAGENLAKDFVSDSGVVAGWMASPGHQANILNNDFRDIGVAAVSCTFQGAPTTIVVAHYGATSVRPQPVTKPTVAPPPTSTAKPTTRQAPAAPINSTPAPAAVPAPEVSPSATPSAKEPVKSIILSTAQTKNTTPVLSAQTKMESTVADIKALFGSILWAAIRIRNWFS